MEVVLNAERFYQRLERFQNDWLTHKSTTWGGADAICIPFGASSDDMTYSKASSFHLFLFGYEFADAIIVITKNNFYFMASAKKCAMLEKDLSGKHESIKINLLVRSKDEGQNREHFNELGNVIRKGGGKKIGSLFKAEFAGNFIPMWSSFIDGSQLEKFDIAAPLGLFFALKDEVELVSLVEMGLWCQFICFPGMLFIFLCSFLPFMLSIPHVTLITHALQDLCKRAAVLSNKVLKHGFVAEMENILDNDSTISHEEMSRKVYKL
jgi:hypothetical protein